MLYFTSRKIEFLFFNGLLVILNMFLGVARGMCVEIPFQRGKKAHRKNRYSHASYFRVAPILLAFRILVVDILQCHILLVWCHRLSISLSYFTVPQ